MADNPRYQRSGIMYADIPTLQYANVTEEIKQARALNASLDRLSEFAYKGAVAKAEKEGAQYGVQNAPTLKQVMDAVTNKEDPSKLFADDYTAFGEAARKSQAVTFRTDLESEARTEFSKINAVIDSGMDYNMNEIESSLQGIIDGHSKVLAKISPDDSLKYRASVSVLGHAVYKNALDRYAKKIESQTNEQIDTQLDTFKSTLPAMLDSYPTFEEFEVAITTDESSLKELIYRGSPDKVDQKLKDLRTIKKNAIMDRIGDYALKDKTFAQTAGEAAIKISEGQAGDYTQYLQKYVPQDEWTEVIKRKTEKSVKQYGLIEANEKLNNKLKEDKYRAYQQDYYTGKIGPDEYLKQLKASDIFISQKEYEEVIGGDKETPANQKRYNYMLNQVETDTLSLGEIDRAAGNSITFKQASNLKDRYFRRSGDDKEANKVILGKLDEVSVDTLKLKPEKVSQAARANRDFKKKQDDARMKGLPFNVSEEAEKSINTVLVSDATTEYTNAQDTLKRITTQYNIPYSENTYTAKDVDDKFKKVIKDEKERKRMKEALRAIDRHVKFQKNNAEINP